MEALAVESGIKVQKATRDEAVWILEQLIRFGAILGKHLGLDGNVIHDTDQAVAKINDLVENHIAFIAFNEGQPVGLIAGHVRKWEFNPTKIALTTATWWVRPESRAGGRVAAKLLSTYLDWGKDNVDLICLALVDGLTPINEKTLLNRGFKCWDKTYAMEVK